MMFIGFHFPRVVSCRSVWHSGSTPHVMNTIFAHYAYFWIFWRGSFEARKKGSRLELAGSQNSFPRMQGNYNNTYFIHEYSCKYPCEPVPRVNHRKVFVYLANPCIATYPKGKLSHS